MTSAIEAADLCYTYPHGGGVRKVSFHAAPGEIICIFGRNGAGKSTLMDLLSTYRIPQGGSYRVGGIDAIHNRAAVRRLIFPVFDSNAHFGTSSGTENLEFFLTTAGVTLKECSPASPFDLPLHQNAGEYSLGMMRKLTLLQAIRSGKKILYFDEPALGLDTPGREVFFTTVRRLADEGTTIVYGTNRFEDVPRADRTLLLENGVLREVASPTEIIPGLIPVQVTIGGKVVLEYLDHMEDLPALVERYLRFGTIQQIKIATQPTEFLWTTDAEETMTHVPAFVRPMVRKLVERYARDKGYVRITAPVVTEAKERFERR